MRNTTLPPLGADVGPVCAAPGAAVGAAAGAPPQAANASAAALALDHCKNSRRLMPLGFLMSMMILLFPFRELEQNDNQVNSTRNSPIRADS